LCGGGGGGDGDGGGDGGGDDDDAEVSDKEITVLQKRVFVVGDLAKGNFILVKLAGKRAFLIT
jgi:hypothetical protein